MALKKAVSAAIRKEWLKRHDEGGESAAAIAREDNFDARTVRKGIEWARREQEVLSVRHTVLSTALSEHYHDLIDHAQRLDNVLAKETPKSISGDVLDHPMHEALKEHLPGAPLWKNLSEWIELVARYEQVTSELEESIKAGFKGFEYDFRKSRNDKGLEEKSLPYSIIKAISLLAQDPQNRWGGVRFRQVAGESPKQMSMGLYEVSRGDYLLASLPLEEVDKFKSDYFRVLDQMDESEKAYNLRAAVRDIGSLTPVLRKELALIIWRKIVPGRCKFCPV